MSADTGSGGASSRAPRSFSGVIARPVVVNRSGLVRLDSLPDNPVPVMRPTQDGVDLSGWVEGHRDEIRQLLHTAGAVLFRGFNLDTTERFQDVVRTYSPSLLDYYERSTPRHALGNGVYTSTEYPAKRSIPLHNECAYSYYWPRTLWFCALQAAQVGGATPLADSRRVLADLPKGTRRRFVERKVTYVRNYVEGLDIPWQTAFQTEDPAVVAEYCKRTGTQMEWRGEVLHTEQTYDAVVSHPDTGEKIWFNQVHASHVSALDSDARAAVESMFDDDSLPRSVRFGDGTAIPDEDIGAVKLALDDNTNRFAWEDGDAMVIDNMLTAHGREAYSGLRRVVVAMTDPWDRPQLASYDRGRES